MLQAQDIEKLVLLGTPAIHPVNRTQAVLAKAVMSLEHDVYMSRLTVYDTKTGNGRPLLPDDHDRDIPLDYSPVWSPDGHKLAFLRKVQGNDELWLYDLQEGTLRSLTPQMKVKSFRFTPDGCKIVFISRVNEVNRTAYLVQRLRYKFDGEGMTSGYTQLFLVDLEDDGDGKIEQLTTRNSDHGVLAFTAAGDKLVYVSDYPEHTDADKCPTFHVMDLATREETSGRPDVKSVTALYPLENGTIMGIGKRKMAESTEIDKWFHWDMKSSVTTWFTDLPELHIGSHLISDSKRPGNPRTAVRRGNRFIYLATYEGRQSLYVLDMTGLAKAGEGGGREIIIGGKNIDGTQIIDAKENMEQRVVTRIPLPLNVITFDVISCDEQCCEILFVGDSMRKPGELYRAVWRNGEEIEVVPLTSCHQEFSKLLPEADIREYRVTAADGLTIHGWSIQALGPDGKPVRKSGTQLWIHGGPHLAYGDAFHFDFWYWTSLGYRVIFCNPRGSTGYGQSFASAIVGRWAEDDLDDIFRFLDHVLQEEGHDEGAEPLYLLGGSYGGYLVNWIIGHDHRFRAAVTERSICNLYSKIGNSDNGFYNNLHQLGGDKDLWTDEETIMRKSPIRYAPQVNTPVLIIHAEQDHRCPIEQAEQWYTALRRLGKEVAFLRLPGASHNYATAGKPRQREARLETIRSWLDEHR